MRFFLEKSFGMWLGKDYYVPIKEIPDYINSLLLIDLFSVWKLALNFVIEKHSIPKGDKLEIRMNALKKKNLLLQAEYIKWYTDWRNDIAHYNKRVEYYILNQAIDDIKKQLIAWDLFPDLPFRAYTYSESERIFKTGVKIENIIILEYLIKFEDQPGSRSTGWSEIVNLSFVDYLDSTK
jgi:hypothetical protein